MREQFIHRLSGNDVLAEIIRKLTKVEESTAVTSKQVLVRAKRVKAQRDQSTIIISESETEGFDKIKTIKGGQRHNLRKLQNMLKHLQGKVAIIVVPAICPDNAQPMGRSMQSAVKSTTLERCVEVGEIELSMV